MSSDLTPYLGAHAPLLRDARRAGRAISRQQAQAQVRLAAIDLETDASLAKVESCSIVTTQAAVAVCKLSQVHKQLETLAPDASGRLAMVVDSHAIMMVELLNDHQRVLRRR
ncbi:MAG: hypothetical protein ACJ74O_06290 [Frankiaceae bacterium]